MIWRFKRHFFYFKRDHDAELCSLALETLHNIFRPSSASDETSVASLNFEVKSNDDTMISMQFSEMFIKNDKTHLELLFDLLDEFEFKVRWSTVKLINQLIVNLTHSMQEQILQIPRGCSRLIDLLNESREIIRNEVIIYFIPNI